VGDLFFISSGVPHNLKNIERNNVNISLSNGETNRIKTCLHEKNNAVALLSSGNTIFCQCAKNGNV
jgi:hypothetical protein